jgi:hypothetical protein
MQRRTNGVSSIICRTNGVSSIIWEGRKIELTPFYPILSHHFIPIGVATQVGFALATRGPAGRRRFWSGFSIGGACALAAQAWLELAQPGPVAELWGAYTAWLDRVFGRLPRLGASNPGHELLHFAVVASFFFPAQLLLASAGGVLALGSGVIRRSKRVANGRIAFYEPSDVKPRD